MRIKTGLPQGGSLVHAKAMLLVNDDEAEALELHVGLDDGMGTND